MFYMSRQSHSIVQTGLEFLFLKHSIYPMAGTMGPVIHNTKLKIASALGHTAHKPEVDG